MRRARLDRLVPVAITIVLVVLLARRLADVDGPAVAQAIASITFGQWVLAGLATALSYWALGQYDCVMHRLLRTGYSARDAMRTGVVSIALAQILGFGAVSGAFLRWRLLSCSPFQAAKISALVAVSFLLCALGIGSVLILSTTMAPALEPLAWIGLALTLGMIVASVGLRDIHVGHSFLPMPSLRALSHMAVLTFVDLAAAGLALWILLPAGHGIEYWGFLAGFVIALGAGLISNAPGGIGAFELTLLALVPLGDPLLLSAILSFRLVYYLIPAGFALVHAATVPRAHPELAVYEAAPRGDGHKDPLDFAARAESQVVRQDGLVLANKSVGVRLACHSSHQSTVMLGDPITGDREPALALLQHIARDTMTTPLLYKVGQPLAQAAAQRGWAVMPIAQEALVDTRSFDTAARGCRQLRRKLRKAERAGLSAEFKGSNLPWAQMHEVSALWASTHGGERGVSTGRFQEQYVSAQRVYLARCGTRLVGFITLNTTESDWALDLIRVHPNAPDGTIHSLVCKAIADAAYREVPRVSLSAAPYTGAMQGWQKALQNLSLRSGSGLVQFKSCFSPEWRTVYAAAPGKASLCVGLADLARDIRYPGPIGRPTKNFHDDYDKLQFAS